MSDLIEDYPAIIAIPVVILIIVALAIAQHYHVLPALSCASSHTIAGCA